MTPPMTPRQSYESLHVSCPHEGGVHRVEGLHWRARQAGALPPVFCVHGLTRRAEDFLALGEALSETRDVYAVSLPGRGGSERIPPNLYTYDQYISDCRSFLEQAGVRQTDWVGTSLGGLLAILIAGSGPARGLIRRLVLNDVGPWISAKALRLLATRVTGYDGTPFESEADAEAFCRFAWEEFGIDDPTLWAEFVQRNLVRSGEGIRLHYDPAIVKGLRNAQNIGDLDLWLPYCKMTCPTLVLRGATSRLLTSETASEMARRGPRPRTVTFSGCGHAPALLNPEQIGAVAGFLYAA